MRTNLTIERIDEKTSKAGRKYNSIVTSQGTMTCFEKPILDKISESIGKSVDVEFTERNGFKNITEFFGDSKPVVEKVIEAPKTLHDKNITILMSYVKDLVISGKVELKDYEETCLRLVKVYKTLSDI